MNNFKIITARVAEIPRKWLRTPEAAKYLGLSKEKIKALREKGLLPYYKLGQQHSNVVLFDINDLDKFVKRNKVY